MATILTKKKDTTGAPSAGDLTNSTGGAELAVNTADKRLYTKDSGGNVVEIGTNPTSITTGTLNTSGAVVFNDAGADVDFRVEGDTEANLLFVDASADAVGIGTSSPTNQLDILNSAAGTQIIRSSNSALRLVSTGGENYIQSGTAPTSSSLASLIFTNVGGANETMRIDSSGNVGIGTSSPAVKLNVVGANDFIRFASTASNISAYQTFYVGGSNRTYFGVETDSGTGIIGTGSAYATVLATAGARILAFGTNDTERMRIDSSGNLLVGTTSGYGSGKIRYEAANLDGVSGKLTGTSGACFVANVASTNQNLAYFVYQDSTEVGKIITNGTSTTYATSSDYRLKENIAPMTGALAKVLELNPVTYTWKSDGSAGQGFIAHELQAVCPEAVTGEKDATEVKQVEVSPAVPATYDDEGNELTPAVEAVYEEREVPVYQGVDTSFLVATLTAAIQELSAKNDALEARIAALENA